ncbi:helix-turn-helix domain-containing protein [Bergeyella sp. RCAD1439]|uniref:helix-turn-helix domain-containing protein n=1 Tax=Bergeyella anatis TaxID=3113737 RepID=UPI002E182F7E|nr:helix-turn-helix domain-containing protein [Bergeyella sp. RCAD1439]
MNQQIFDLAEHTNRSLFLTGKAGTGKTTFLNHFVKNTQKKHLIVAPTGIAAINAGGVTIHSMFGLPLRPFFPTLERIDGSMGNNIADLIQHFKYRKDKLKLLREVEILIIDEVSMLRADVLDMMDFALRHIRRIPAPFGGVQMLFIGDLYQLPPVVRDENLLSKYYASPFFFSAKALENLSLVTIELTKVYRQKDEHFLSILNAIRDGERNKIDFQSLNSRYIPDFDPKGEAYVYLTSHNRMAEEINREKLNELGGKSYFYEAKIFGDFKENQYPNEATLELKVGSQVMFIRNDASGEKRYYNGKLAEVSSLSEDRIGVIIEGEDQEYLLKTEAWENKKYSLAQDKTVQEEVLGSFEQYPIRLAWAVTIHKSQGLTFDRVIIDAGKSFASGQVYVALSRCRTLEGIVLKSPITPEAIFSDRRVSGFQNATNANDQIDQILNSEKYDYSIGKVLSRTDCRWLSNEIEQWHKAANESKKTDPLKTKALYYSLKSESENLGSVFEKFEKVLKQKTKKFVEGKEDWTDIEQKSKGAVLFFFQQVHEKLFDPLKQHYAETKGVSGMKAYNEHVKTLIDDLQDYLKGLQDVRLLETPLFDEKEKKEISAKAVKIPTHLITWNLFSEGKTLPEIAKERGLVPATIIGHFSKFAETKQMTEEDLKRLLPKEKIKTFENQFQIETFDSLNDWKKHLPDDFEYGEIRLLKTFYENR